MQKKLHSKNASIQKKNKKIEKKKFVVHKCQKHKLRNAQEKEVHDKQKKFSKEISKHVEQQIYAKAHIKNEPMILIGKKK